MIYIISRCVKFRVLISILTPGKANIYYNKCSDDAKRNRDLLISTCERNGFVVNEDEWWHFYDERIKKHGMKYNFLESDLIPVDEDEVFILQNIENSKILKK